MWTDEQLIKMGQAYLAAACSGTVTEAVAAMRKVMQSAQAAPAPQAAPVPAPSDDPKIEKAIAEGEFEPGEWTVSACRAIEKNPSGALIIIQRLKQELAAATASPAAAAPEPVAQAVPYLYVYEYATHLGLHREFYPRKHNGSMPTRTVALYLHPAPAVAAAPQASAPSGGPVVMRPMQFEDGRHGWYIDEFCEVRLMLGNGHSGYGLYVSISDYPEEGAELLAALKAPEQLSEAQIRAVLTPVFERQEQASIHWPDIVEEVRAIERALGITATPAPKEPGHE